ncbi:predicted protein [Chaetoceros tenuissimus]|uniref:LNR domain-containing protein n=1 Tax=Chaetoceros tenuissimus TaxID=426638 RepID=A0AAD3DBH0_9STRA|nr:predicted protein [Chaetoceros tenuissimus]
MSLSILGIDYGSSDDDDSGFSDIYNEIDALYAEETKKLDQMVDEVLADEYVSSSSSSNNSSNQSYSSSEERETSSGEERESSSDDSDGTEVTSNRQGDVLIESLKSQAEMLKLKMMSSRSMSGSLSPSEKKFSEYESQQHNDDHLGIQQSVYDDIDDIERIESQDETVLPDQYVFENITKLAKDDELGKDGIIDEAQSQSQDLDQLLSFQKTANNSLSTDQYLSISPEKESLSEGRDNMHQELVVDSSSNAEGVVQTVNNSLLSEPDQSLTLVPERKESLSGGLDDMNQDLLVVQTFDTGEDEFLSSPSGSEKDVENGIVNEKERCSDSNGHMSLSSDVVSLLFVSRTCMSFLLVILAFLLKFAILTIISFNEFFFPSDTEKNLWIWTIPMDVTLSMRILQGVVLLFVVFAVAVYIFGSIQMMIVLRSNNTAFWKQIYHLTKSSRIGSFSRIPYLLRFFEGLFILFASLLVIVQIKDVVPLLTGILVINTLPFIDSLLFKVVEYGLVGNQNQRYIWVCKQVKVEYSGIKLMRGVFFFVALISYTAWGLTIDAQERGNFIWKKPMNVNCTTNDHADHNYEDCSQDSNDSPSPCDQDEDGNCLISVEGMPGCKVASLDFVNNKKCDLIYNTTECSYDFGDCKLKRIPHLPGCKAVEEFLGDGICDEYFNTSLCLYDYGDCI